MKKFLNQLNDLWIIAGITLLLLMIIELAFSILYNTRSSIDSRAEADCYPKEDWVKDLYREFSASGHESWHPYVYWRRKPFSGQYINIGDDGLRKSTYPAPDTLIADPAIRLFFMGGSTLWGTGVRDEFTIPSQVGAILNHHGLNTEVLNFGESGYVSTQELVALFIALQKGNIPDIVVFYDGVNDVFSAFQQNEAGVPQNEHNRRAEFNAFRGKKAILKSMIKSLYSFSTVRFITENISRKKDFSSMHTTAESDALTSAVARHYWSNVQIVESLGSAYGFRTVFYWQPAIFNKRHLTEYEKEQLKEITYLQQFYELAYLKTKNMAVEFEGSDFHDISELFENVTEPIYVDWCHPGEQGNVIISKRMTDDLIQVCREVLKEKTTR